MKKIRITSGLIKICRKKNTAKKICSLIFRKLLSFSTKKILRKKIISFLRTCFFSIIWSAISMWRWLLWFQFAPKKTCDQRNHTYRKVDDPWEIKFSSFSTRTTTLSAASQYLLLSSTRSNGISWWDFWWVLLVDGVHLSLLDLSWPGLSHFLINLAGLAGEAGILAKISIMPVSTERFCLAI